MDDFVVRILRYLGYRVRTTMNITDVEDKIIRDSREKWLSRKEFTDFYTAAFLEDCGKIGIIPADNIMPITNLIDDMGEIIDGLIQKWYAYLAEDGSIYYSVSKFRKYGELAHLDFDGMISSVRIKNDEYDKEQVADFALWKAYDAENDGENKWAITVTLNGEKKTIEWRPGWHIECSACNRHFFGDQIDIHMGWVDLVFPHHQNEIAQTEAFTGKQFSKYWLHGGHLLVDNKKMSKSAGNFYTLRDIVEKFSSSVIANETTWSVAIQVSEKKETRFLPSQEWQTELIYRGFRLMALQNQYRENFNFTFDRLTAAINTICWLDEMMKRLGRALENTPPANDERNAHGKMKFHDISREFRENQQYYMQEFIEKLENDFDTVSAMTIVFEFQTYVNTGIDEDLFSHEELKSLIDLLKSWDAVLGILNFNKLTQDLDYPEDIFNLAVARIDAKAQKNWAEADRIRDELKNLGWNMIDEAGGKWRVERI
jgi:cysteinyl-tRNA synthetase